MNLISLLPTSNYSIANVLLAWKPKWKPSEMVMLSVHSDVGWHTNIKKRLAKKNRQKGRVSRVLFLLATQFFSSLQLLLVCIPQSLTSWHCATCIHLLGHKRPDSHGSSWIYLSQLLLCCQGGLMQLCKCKMRREFLGCFSCILISHPLLGPLCHKSCNNSIFSTIVVQLFQVHSMQLIGNKHDIATGCEHEAPRDPVKSSNICGAQSFEAAPPPFFRPIFTF